MDFRELERVFPVLLDEPKLSIELVSSPGLGKSEFVEQQVARMSKRDGEEWGFATMFLATQTPPDLIGYQFKSERVFPGFNNDRAVSVTDPSMPLWLFTRDGRPVHSFKRGLLFLDEYGQGDADVKRASAELLLNGRIGPWSLPEGWTVVAASNRSEDRSGVTKSFDFVINRRLEIQVDANVNAWEEWAMKNGIDPLFVSFAVQNPQIVFDGKVPEKQGPWCTPRSLVKVASLLTRMSNGGPIPTDGVATSLASGLIGMGAVAQLMAWVKLGLEAPKYEDIVKDPLKAKMPKKPDLQMLVAYNLAARVSATDIESVMTYMTREKDGVNEMPKEFAVTLCKSAAHRNPTIITNKAITSWLAKNPSLASAFAKA